MAVMVAPVGMSAMRMVASGRIVPGAITASLRRLFPLLTMLTHTAAPLGWPDTITVPADNQTPHFATFVALAIVPGNATASAASCAVQLPYKKRPRPHSGPMPQQRKCRAR
ncbi:MAG: hypothetical protein WCY72_03075 [Lysobacteraceae bacterium]